MPGARDGQLRVRRGTDSPPWALQMFDDDLGLWLTLCQADVEEDAMRAGIPILRGPYIVDFSDIPHDGDTLTLWTPAVGDVLLGIVNAGDSSSWDTGGLNIGVVGLPDLFFSAILGGAGPYFVQWEGAYLFSDTAAVQVQLNNPSPNPDPTQGHVELYALVARAVAP